MSEEQPQNFDPCPPSEAMPQPLPPTNLNPDSEPPAPEAPPQPPLDVSSIEMLTPLGEILQNMSLRNDTGGVIPGSPGQFAPITTGQTPLGFDWNTFLYYLNLALPIVRPQDPYAPVFMAATNSSNAFQEQTIVNGTVGNYTDGRTGTLIPYTGSVMLEIQDSTTHQYIAIQGGTSSSVAQTIVTDVEFITSGTNVAYLRITTATAYLSSIVNSGTYSISFSSCGGP